MEHLSKNSLFVDLTHNLLFGDEDIYTVLRTVPNRISPGISRTSLLANTGIIERELRNDPKPILI